MNCTISPAFSDAWSLEGPYGLQSARTLAENKKENKAPGYSARVEMLLVGKRLT